jgi:hypothetical protein
MCILCPITSLLGGAIGGYFFGVYPPENSGGKFLSLAVAANLASITSIALSSIFKISLCGGGGFTPANIALVLIKGIIMGTIYSIGVNYLLGRYVFPPSDVEEPIPDLAQDQKMECSCHCP